MPTETYDPTLGKWVPAIPEPYYHTLLPWLWRRLIGWRDAYGREARLLKPWE